MSSQPWPNDGIYNPGYQGYEGYNPNAGNFQPPPPPPPNQLRDYGHPPPSAPPPYQPKYPETQGYPMEASANPGGEEMTGYPGDPEDSMNNFTEASIRKGFIRKVFAILSAQLVVTFGIMSIFVFSEDAKEFIQDNPWIMWAAVITTFVLCIALACGEKLRRQFPANIICLAIFTLAMAWLLSSTASYFDASEVLIAVGMCMGVTFIMFLFGLQTKYDFTWMIGPLVSILFCLIVFGFMCIFMQDRILNLLYACIGAIVFSLFITIDVQMVIGKGRYAFDSEEYIMASLNIYLDIINLLLAIFAIMQSSK